MSKPRRYIERRFAPIDPASVEVRDDDNGLRFRGHAAVFNQEVDFGFMREVVAPGAFAKTIKDGADVRFLFNHDPSTVMARTSVGSLDLSEDDDGLSVEARLDPDDLDTQRLVPKLRSGNVSQMSFGFSVVKDEMTEDEDDENPLRTLRELELFDVSPVTFPAYEGTDGGLRAAFQDVNNRLQVLGLPLVFGRAQSRDAGDLIDELLAIKEPTADPERVRAAIDALTTLVTEPAIETPTPAGDMEPSLGHSLEQLYSALNRNRLAVA